MQIKQVLDDLEKTLNKVPRKGLSETQRKGLRVSMRHLRDIASTLGVKNPPLARELWESPHDEMRILACLVADPNELSTAEAQRGVQSTDSWLVCDICCNELLWQTTRARELALEWTEAVSPFVKRAGFSLIASIAMHSTQTRFDDIGFYDYSLFAIRKHANDTRPYVLQGVVRALRQIGKRDANLHEAAVETAEEIRLQPSQEARWVARCALASLKSSHVQELFNLTQKVDDDTF